MNSPRRKVHTGPSRAINWRCRFRPILRCLEDRTVPSTITWDGGPAGTGTRWLEPANWVGDVLPGPNDDAVIAGDQHTTIVLDGSTAVRSANVPQRDLHCISGELTIGAGSSFFWLTLAGGTLNPLTGATIGGAIYGTGQLLIVASGSTLNLSSCYVQMDTANNGTIVFSGGPNPNYLVGTVNNSANAIIRVENSLGVYGGLTNQGTIEVGSNIAGAQAVLYVGTPDVLINAPTGTITTLAGAGGPRTITAQFANQGLITIGSNSTLSYDRAASINAGIIDITGGNLSLKQSVPGASFSNTGTVTVAAGRQLTVTGAAFANSLGGTLAIDGTCIGAVANNGTMAGSGSITGNVSGNGIVSPGSSPGILTVTGSFTGTGPMALELNGTDTGTQYDQLKVNGSVTLSGPLNATLGYTAADGDTLRIIDNDASDPIVGTFAGLPQGTDFVIGGATFRISYVGGTGNDVTLTRVAASPHVSQVVIDDGTAQRSRVSQIKVVFDHIITYSGAPNAAYQLQKIIGGQPNGNVELVINTVLVGDHSEATLTFASDTTFGSLNDGRYRLNVIGKNILYNGVPMAQDYVVNFQRFFGDANGDGRVDIGDYGRLSTSYDKHFGDPGYLAYFDYNGDGHVDFTDFEQFALRYLARLP